MAGLQDVVQEYLKAPLVNMLPQPLFTSSSSVCLEEGMRQMSEVVAGMSETVLSDQGSQEGPVKNTVMKFVPWTHFLLSRSCLFPLDLLF